MASKVIFLVTLGFLAASAAVLEHDGDEGPLSNTCLKALFEVLNANAEDPCTGIRCNPFKISLDQWRTAYNVRAGEGESAYNKCMTSHWCSARTVQDYMSRTLALCVRRTPSTDSYRSVCESALILHLGDPTQCQTASNEGTIQTYRDMLLESLDRRTKTFLDEGLESEDAGSGQSELNEFELKDQSAEPEVAENEMAEESIQENKFDFNIMQLLNENEMNLHVNSETPERN